LYLLAHGRYSPSGTAEVADELGAERVPDIRLSPFGAPLLNDVFRLAHSRAKHDTLCFVNADIVFRGDIGKVIGLPSPFLVVGESFDVDLREPLECSAPDWRSRLPCGDVSRCGGRSVWARLSSTVRPLSRRFISGTNTAIWLADAGRPIAASSPAGTSRWRGCGATSIPYSMLDAEWMLTEHGLRPRPHNFAFLNQLCLRLLGLYDEIAGPRSTRADRTGPEHVGDRLDLMK